jgi:tetratricopeptide (TPR) repeat protein
MDRNAAEKQWQELIEQGVVLYQQGDIKEAMLLEERALELARKIYNLAESCNSQWNFTAAKPLYVEALAMRRRLFGYCDHDDLAASINNLAVLYECQGNLSIAESLYVEALAMRRRLFEYCDHDNLAVSINNLAGLYESQGKYSTAEPLMEEALAMCRRLFENCDHNDLASTINNLAALYQSQGKYDKSELLNKEALAMCRRLFGNCDHNDLAASINNLAGCYQSQGKYSDAESLHKEALSMRRRLFADIDHNNLAVSIHNLAASYNAQGEYSDAESLYVEALEMCRRLFADIDHNDLASAITSLAGCYQSQGKYSDAESLHKEALLMRRRLFADCDHDRLANSINNLAGTHIAQQQPEKAFPLIVEAVEVKENILRQWFGYSTESNRIGFVERNQAYLDVLVSFLCEYFPDDSEKIAQVAIAVARRKAFAAQAEVELNYLRYSDRYPDLAADFRELATAQGKLTHLNHTYYHHQGAMDDLAREAHQQAKQTLTEQIDRLERKLSANVPELRQLQENVTLPAIFAALPDDSCAIEFYRFDVYNFAGNELQNPQYVAFILAPGGNVGLVKLGDAGEIDGLIDRYRNLAGDVNLPSFGARPNPANPPSKVVVKVEDVEIDRQLSDRLVMPILETIGGEIKQLIFIPDGAVNFLPIGNLLVGSETRLFEKVGFLGASLGERFVCTYLSTARSLILEREEELKP